MSQPVTPEKNKLELAAMNKVLEVLNPLDDDGRRRVLWYVVDVYGLNQRPGPQQVKAIPPGGPRQPGS